MSGRKRTVQVKFYVAEEERKLIEAKMKLVPTSNMAAYLRKIAIDGYIIQVDYWLVMPRLFWETNRRGTWTLILQTKLHRF